MVKISRVAALILAFSGCAYASNISPTPLLKDYSKNVVITRELAIRERGDVSPHNVERGFIQFIWDMVITLASGASLGFSTGDLASVGFGTAIGCLAPSNPISILDCLWITADVLLSTFRAVFSPSSGFRRSTLTLDGYSTYQGTVTAGDGSSATFIHTQIMPLVPGRSMLHTLATRANASSFALAYTRQVGNHSLVAVHHRRLNSSDSPDDNGEYHQLRGFHSSLVSGGKREEVTAENEVVMDYLWKFNNENDWDQINSQVNAPTFGSPASSIIRSTFYNNGAEDVIASCASVASLSAAGQLSYVNQGVMAFGWNDKPFGFDGRATTWVDGCIS